MGNYKKNTVVSLGLFFLVEKLDGIFTNIISSQNFQFFFLPCRKNKNDISKLIFKSGDFQMSPYAEYPKNPRSQEWGREAIEMHENGSTKNLLQMTDVYYSVCIPMPKWPPSSNFLGELKGFCFFVLGFFCLFWFGFLVTTHNLQNLSFQPPES